MLIQGIISSVINAFSVFLGTVFISTCSVVCLGKNWRDVAGGGYSSPRTQQRFGYFGGLSSILWMGWGQWGGTEGPPKWQLVVVGCHRGIWASDVGSREHGLSLWPGLGVLCLLVGGSGPKSSQT